MISYLSMKGLLSTTQASAPVGSTLYRRGGNLYRTKQQNYLNSWSTLRLYLCVVTVVLSAGYYGKVNAKPVNAQIISPLPKGATTPNVSLTPTPTAVPTPTQYQLIAGEIKDVFGDKSEQAFKVLSCENSSLNPAAINTNTDGSKDYGVFQINDKWQGVTNKAFLTDYHINIRMAYNIFTHSKNWHLWTCGRKFGI